MATTAIHRPVSVSDWKFAATLPSPAPVLLRVVATADHADTWSMPVIIRASISTPNNSK